MLGMGLNRHQIEMLAREHLYRPIRGDVLMIGRQSVYLSPDEFIDTLGGIGVDVSGADAAKIELDRGTLNRVGLRDDLVSDRGIFVFFGGTRVRAIDLSGYEGSEIVHDLNLPVPSSLRAIVDVAEAPRNYCDMAL